MNFVMIYQSRNQVTFTVSVLLKCTIQCFQCIYHVVQLSPLSHSEHFTTPQKTQNLFVVSPYSALQPMGTISLLLVPVRFAYFGISCKWNNMICGFCDLFLSLTMMFSGFIRVVAQISTSLLFTAEYYSILWMYHFLFIHSLTDGHLTCVQFLVVMNSAVMNTHILVFLCEHNFSVLLGISWKWNYCVIQ